MINSGGIEECPRSHTSLEYITMIAVYYLVVVYT